MKVQELNIVENMLTKEKLLVLSNSLFSLHVFKTPSAAQALESVYMRERVNHFLLCSGLVFKTLQQKQKLCNKYYRIDNIMYIQCYLQFHYFTFFQKGRIPFESLHVRSYLMLYSLSLKQTPSNLTLSLIQQFYSRVSKSHYINII